MKNVRCADCARICSLDRARREGWQICDEDAGRGLDILRGYCRKCKKPTKQVKLGDV